MRFNDILSANDRDTIRRIDALSTMMDDPNLTSKDKITAVLTNLRLALIMTCIEKGDVASIPGIGTIRINKNLTSNRVSNLDFYMDPQFRQDFNRIWANKDSVILNDSLNGLREAISRSIEREESPQ